MSVKLMKSLIVVTLAVIMILGFGTQVAFAGGPAGGKVTGALDLKYMAGAAFETRCQFLVQERGGMDSKGMVSCEVYSSENPNVQVGAFWEGDVVCGIVFPTDPPTAEFVVEIRASNIPGVVVGTYWFVWGEDGGEPSAGLDWILTAPAPDDFKWAFCFYAADLGDPPGPPHGTSSGDYQSIGGGNLQINLK